MQERGLRYNQDKREWSLVDFKALESMVSVLEYGKQKYTTKEASGADNWKKGMPVKETLESLLRHTFALLRGEINDPESGLPHIGHLMCNAMFASYMIEQKPEFNNLPKIEEK